MVPQKTWWYSRINDLQRAFRFANASTVIKTEERLEIRRMLEETLRLLDDLDREV